MTVTIDNIEGLFDTLMDMVFARIRQPQPPMKQLLDTKLISHRGVFDNRNIFENTLPAFQKASDRNIWGIELDIRWTEDLHPVVFHDPDLLRLFGRREIISELKYSGLKKKFPAIPSLHEIVEVFGGKTHLMVEIKSETSTFVGRKNRVLADIFSKLTPCKDYHFIGFDPEMYRYVDFVPPPVFLPIARTNIGFLSRQAIAKGFGGFCGHYALMSRAVIKRHQKVGQRIGTGFPNSLNCLFREIHRGVEWIFSDRADALQQMISAQLDVENDVSRLDR
jgi:glycerophosphoryl diester phosphodiesterase